VNLLAEIVADTRRDLERRRRDRPLAEVVRGAERRLAEDRAPRSLLAALRSRQAIGLIAEHKRRSPSAGLIRGDLSIEQVVAAYERGGATGVSVLTESSRFGGSLADLAAARGATGLPILRKDFIVDAYQVHEALAGGADAVLLIVAALDEHELGSLLRLAGDLGLDALVEVHDGDELARATAAGARLIGVNNRDLATLHVDVGRTFELLAAVPDGVVVVAESGLSKRAQLDELHGAGVHGVLIGEALMRAADIEQACRALTLVQI
jgi:indole-3-glycerol phosphate synthase